jgi:hypothetical protein
VRACALDRGFGLLFFSELIDQRLFACLLLNWLVLSLARAGEGYEGLLLSTRGVGCCVEVKMR